MNSDAYRKYIASSEWKRKRELALERAKHSCMRCGLPKSWCGPLEVHHLTYDNLGNEPMKDLLVLCLRCHKIADRERVEKRESDEYSNALSTYCEKKFEIELGDEITEDMIDDFDEWVERKQWEDNGY